MIIEEVALTRMEILLEGDPDAEMLLADEDSRVSTDWLAR
jgi:hypothetical protein